VDFDPDIIEALNKRNIQTIFGDISDPEIAQVVNVEKASLIISTASDPEDNLLLLKSLKSIKGPKVIVAAFEKTDAKDFYKAGADYVIMPHIAGGNHLANILIDDNHLKLIEEYKEKEKSLIK
jgi:Trk K+ transport system NAD-binding subunit